MKYRLSLDLGVSSIGTAVIELNNELKAIKITDSSVRIFPVSEGAEGRRTARQQRKNNERTKQRLKLLAQNLYENGLWEFASPEIPKEKQNLYPYVKSPYAIRANAINGKLNSPLELGRAILHLAKHRGAGFVEALQESLEEDEVADEQSNKKKGKEKKSSSYELLSQYMKKNDSRTIGEYFHKRLCGKEGRIVRQRTTSLVKEKPVDYAIPRYLVKDEFKQIWDFQCQYSIF